MSRTVREERGQGQTDPNSWSGQEADGWWTQQRRKADEMRGR